MAATQGADPFCIPEISQQHISVDLGKFVKNTFDLIFRIYGKEKYIFSLLFEWF